MKQKQKIQLVRKEVVFFYITNSQQEIIDFDEWAYDNHRPRWGEIIHFTCVCRASLSARHVCGCVDSNKRGDLFK